MRYSNNWWFSRSLWPLLATSRVDYVQIRPPRTVPVGGFPVGWLGRGVSVSFSDVRIALFLRKVNVPQSLFYRWIWFKILGFLSICLHAGIYKSSNVAKFKTNPVKFEGGQYICCQCQSSFSNKNIEHQSSSGSSLCWSCFLTHRRRSLQNPRIEKAGREVCLGCFSPSEKPVTTRSMEPFFTTGPWERATPQGMSVVYYIYPLVN